MGHAAASKQELSVARFFVPKKSIRGDRASVVGGELEHMRRVLRLGPGDRVVLFDDDGSEHEGTIDAYRDGSAEIAIARSYRPGRDAPLAITLAPALGKGDKLDLVVEKATELGVAAITPFVSRRTVPQLGADASRRRAERWRRIALAAAKQCGRTSVPEVHEPVEFAEMVRRAESTALKIVFWEDEKTLGLQALREQTPSAGALFIVVGPEGGFAPEEVDLATRGGFRSVGLGRRILRTETAAIAAVALAQLLWGDLG
jgi:16S rRNA (uracil1498-N3)-methyltransferase